MKLQIAKQIDIESALPHMIKPIKKRPNNSVSNGLMDQFMTSIKNNKDDLAVSRVTVIDNEKSVAYFAKSSVFMMYQLIETTPQIKKALLKYAESNKSQLIKDMDNRKMVATLSKIVDRTPANLIDDARNIARIMTLACYEVNEMNRPYTNVLLDAIPPLRNWVDVHTSYINEKKFYHDMVSELLYNKTLNLDNQQIKRLIVEYDIDAENDKFIEFVKRQSLNELKRLAQEDNDIPSFTIDDIKLESKRLDNVHSQIRTQHNENEDEEVFKYTLRDMYFLGALLFLDDYLGLLPESVYTFNSDAELHVYLKECHTIHALYASKTPLSRIKPVKSKERPIHIANNESFGNMLRYAVAKEDGDIWTSFIIQLYTQMGLRGDILWNTQLEKRDIDTVAQLLKQWDTLKTHNTHMEDDEKPLFFVMGLLIMALEKQQQNSDKYINETIIRMDEQQELELRTIIQQKERTINRLEDTIEKQNKSLSQLESLRQKNRCLEEQLTWQEERIEQEETIHDIDDDIIQNDIDVSTIKQRLNQNDVCFMGGDPNWHNALRQDLPLANFQLAEESGRSMSHVEKAKIIVYNTATMNHGLFYRFKNSMKRNTNAPIVIYLNTQGSNKTLTYQRIGQQLNPHIVNGVSEHTKTLV